ncbi:MAG: hypothetical protein K1X88_25785 [Nannocystaceae bacterium]|nr:hypothetical protein [Nannocystaceae bacterium]
MRRPRGRFVDWVTQLWVRATGRRVAPDAAAWLVGPVGEVDGVGDTFFEQWAADHGLTVLPADQATGLLPRFEALRSPGFDPAAVDPAIVRFYEHTAAYELRIEPRWRGPFRALGWLIARIFARRLAQLNLPLSRREVASGVRSRVVALCDGDGRRLHTGWVRTSIATGMPLFVGDYGLATIPGCDTPCVRVVFPLPHGNAIVALRPVCERGRLMLLSDGRRFGDTGFYFTVVRPQGLVARYVRTMKERLELWVDDGRVRAQHRFAVFGLVFLQLDYTIVAKDGGAAD